MPELLWIRPSRRCTPGSGLPLPFAVLTLVLCAGIGCAGSNSGSQTSPGTQTASPQVTLVGISVSSAALNGLPVGETAQLAATATYNNQSTGNVSATAAWSSSNPAVATVSSSGVVAAVAVGTATLSASVSGVSGGAQMTVVAPVVESIVVSPATPTIISGTTQQFSAAGKYSDGSTADVSTQAQWSFSNAIAMISSTGLATGQSSGSGTVSASLSGVAGTTTLTVDPKALTSIRVLPNGVTLYRGGTQQLAAIGSYNDGSTADVTSLVTWTSPAPNSASVSTGGLVSALAAGSTAISASSGSISGTSSLTVSASNSGFTLIDDQTDSRLLLFQGTDGSVAQYNGTRTAVGGLNTITSTNVSHPDGTTQTVLYDDQARPIDFQASDGSEFAISWPSDASSSPVVTAFSGDHKFVFSAPFTFPASSSSGSSVVPARMKGAGLDQEKGRSTPPANDPSLVTVNVTSYDGLAESDAIVKVSESGPFLGGSITAALTQPGTYQAHLPTGSSIPSLESVDDAVKSILEPLDAPCEILDKESKATALLPTPFGNVNTAICLGIATAVDIATSGAALPASGAIVAACTGLGVATEILDQVCDIATDVSGVSKVLSVGTTSIINFFNGLSTNVTATASLNQDLESATNKSQPSTGPFAPFTISDGAVPVAAVTVVPSTATLALGASIPLSAEALDADADVLKSSTFQWSWTSDSNIVSVPSTGVAVPYGVLQSVGAATVTATGSTGGTAHVTAIEQASGQSGTSVVTVKPPTKYSFTGVPFSYFSGSAGCPSTCKITGWFTVPQPLNVSTLSPISPMSFTFTDGTNTYEPFNSGADAFSVSTDKNGNIVEWSIALQPFGAGGDFFLITEYQGSAYTNENFTDFVSGYADTQGTGIQVGSWTMTP